MGCAHQKFSVFGFQCSARVVVAKGCRPNLQGLLWGIDPPTRGSRLLCPGLSCGWPFRPAGTGSGKDFSTIGLHFLIGSRSEKYRLPPRRSCQSNVIRAGTVMAATSPALRAPKKAHGSNYVERGYATRATKRMSFSQDGGAEPRRSGRNEQPHPADRCAPIHSINWRARSAFRPSQLATVAPVLSIRVTLLLSAPIAAGALRTIASQRL